jgi:adenylate cyclase
VNFASRLEAANKVYDTKILVSEAIHTICKDYFEFKPLPPLTVKGKSEPAKVYELIAVIMG